MKLLIIIPTYNEAENIESLVKVIIAVTSNNQDYNVKILIIDDNSPDGTAGIVENLIRVYPGKLYLQCREGKQGGASAFLKGFSWGMENDYDIMLAMDADFSHDPKYIPQMLDAISGNDMVIGSRNVKGGGIENRSWIRNVITKCAALYCRTVLHCPINDFTGGYNMYRKEVFEKIDVNAIQCRGYSFQIEIKYKAFMAGLRLAEIPIIFPDRKYGKSKMSSGFLLNALFDVLKIKRTSGTDTGIDQFLKFAITGGLGTITNLLIFFICVDIFRLSPTPVSIGCFFIAGTQNYILNHKWSFRRDTNYEKISWKKWFLFLCAASIGLCINLITLNMVLSLFLLPYKFIAQAAGIAAGMIFNFFALKLIVFRRKINDK